MELFHPTYTRTIPPRRRTGFQPASGRYSLRWRRPVPYLIADWFGIQGAEPGSLEAHRFVEQVKTAFTGDLQPEAVEVMACPIDETGLPAVVVVAYWTSATAHARWSLRKGWTSWWESEDRLGDGVGYWRETLVCPYDRHETVYSHEHYRIGFGRTPDTEIVGMTDNGYFGAARDRIPASAIDELESPLDLTLNSPHADPRGQRLFILTPLNTTVIRSGQFWQESEPDQAKDYETSLRPKLHAGMDYLAEDRDSGCIYLRRLTNLDDQGHPRRETSIFAVFQELAQLERWAADHTTHKAIYGHQIAAGRKYGARRDVITWHEAFVLPANNCFEYINCAAGTGMTRSGPTVSKSS